MHTDRGPITAGTVVCAAGAWSQAIGQMVDTPLPVTPLRRQIVFTEPLPDLPEVVPFTIDFTTSFYFHREGRGLLMGMSDPEQEPGFHLGYSDDWLPRLGDAIGIRTPRLLDVGLHSGWAGLYEVTPTTTPSSDAPRPPPTSCTPPASPGTASSGPGRRRGHP